AAGGANLVLTARRVDRLGKLAGELSSKQGGEVGLFPTDLVRPEAPNQIYDFTQGKNIEIELLVNNAGFGAFGLIHEIPAERMTEMIQVNCSAEGHLTPLYSARVITRPHRDVLILASTAAFPAVPFNSVYAATKAFDLLFVEGI